MTWRLALAFVVYGMIAVYFFKQIYHKQQNERLQAMGISHIVIRHLLYKGGLIRRLRITESIPVVRPYGSINWSCIVSSFF